MAGAADRMQKLPKIKDEEKESRVYKLLLIHIIFFAPSLDLF